MTKLSQDNFDFHEPLIIHATNVVGLGAQQVVLSLLDALLPIAHYDPITVFLPENGLLADYHSNLPNVRLVTFRRMLPRQLSRLLECLWPPSCFRGEAPLLVLSDVPLARRKRQVVLVHQPNLLAPSVNPHVGRNWRMRTLRATFRRNHPSADVVVVQTDVMADQLKQSYHGLKGRLHVIPQPPPVWATQGKIQAKQQSSGPLRLFYPAAGYPHKNHELLVGMGSYLATANEDFENIRIAVTLQEESIGDRSFPDFIENLGRLDVSQVQQVYQNSDALFFPSVLESLGLPLVEAICMGLPIVCADLPYAHWLCEDQACYFDPRSPADAVRAIYDLQRKLRDGWLPDYSMSRSKLPDSWHQVAKGFLDLLADV